MSCSWLKLCQPQVYSGCLFLCIGLFTDGIFKYQNTYMHACIYLSNVHTPILMGVYYHIKFTGIVFKCEALKSVFMVAYWCCSKLYSHTQSATASIECPALIQKWICTLRNHSCTFRSSLLKFQLISFQSSFFMCFQNFCYYKISLSKFPKKIRCLIWHSG